jgi:GDP-L-fucose synthase
MRSSNQRRVFVAGHRGLVGSAILRCLRHRGYSDVIVRDRHELDLRKQEEVLAFFEQESPTHVYLAAAKVGGIHANRTFPAEFIHDNLLIASNVIHAAYRAKVSKLLFMGSSCIYPKFAAQPIKEEALLTGELEPTNEAYSIAKIAGLKMCAAYNAQYGTDFMGVMPTNIYGPGDHYDLNNCHVLPALLRKFHDAKLQGERSVTVWGTGTPRREFLFSEDLAQACVFLMENYDAKEIGDFVNVGTGVDLPIGDLASLIAQTVGFEGEIVYDTAMPDGTPRKLLDVTRITDLGWRSSVSLPDGICRTYRSYLESFGAESSGASGRPMDEF